ncbi:hypothetical protein LH417_07920 [Laribacter hongkongensis]|uniref:hypothetical protein n=1 Tax=Laribacter hongkongensis TaxID=168471 RepID=UPI001EFDB691|nr:hypothetical protein [Laribacter hongkongensis]MCG9022867.1 hypothetical protein [Laribacter hongkongensis]
MVPHAVKRLQDGTGRNDSTGTTCRTWKSGKVQALPLSSMGPLPAAEIERAVLTQVHQVLQAPEMIIAVWQANMASQERAAMDEPSIVVAMRQISAEWEHLFPAEQNRIMRLLIERVQLRDDGMDILWHDDS